MARAERTRRKRRKAPVLRVSARQSRKKKGRYGQIAGVIAVPLVVLVGVFLLWLGIRELGALLYRRSDAFQIRDLQVLATSARTKALVKDYTRIHEGQNIFALDIGKVREYVMANSPNFQSLTITRYLPDKVVINVVDRTPLARIGYRGGMVADSEGCVFIARGGVRGLPTISGYDSRDLKPGMRIESQGLAALQLIDACENPHVEMRPLDVDVSHSEKLVLQAEYAGRKREIPISWPGMGQVTAASRKNLNSRLLYIKQSFDKPEGRRLSYLDATINGRLFGR